MECVWRYHRLWMLSTEIGRSMGARGRQITCWNPGRIRLRGKPGSTVLWSRLDDHQRM